MTAEQEVCTLLPQLVDNLQIQEKLDNRLEADRCVAYHIKSIRSNCSANKVYSYGSNNGRIIFSAMTFTTQYLDLFIKYQVFAKVSNSAN